MNNEIKAKASGQSNYCLIHSTSLFSFVSFLFCSILLHIHTTTKYSNDKLRCQLILIENNSPYFTIITRMNQSTKLPWLYKKTKKSRKKKLEKRMEKCITFFFFGLSKLGHMPNYTQRPSHTIRPGNQETKITKNLT